MKHILSAALLASIAFGGIAASAEKSKIMVSASPIQQWAGDVSRKLDRKLSRVARYGDPDYHQGIVQVRFSRGENGVPENVTLYRKSGSRSLDRDVLRAVRNLKGLQPLPAGFQGNRLIQANVVIAKDRFSYDTLERELRQIERARIASSSPGEREVLALNATVAPAS